MFERAFLIAGLGFGDEGKGSIVDWLTRRHDGCVIVRYNGGPQAAHHVVTSDGRLHCFAQVGAGSFVPATRTFLSRYMLIDPLALQAEVDDLHRKGAASIWPRLSIDRRCTVVTPFHRLLNEMQELARGGNRHGSCGRGVGQAQLDSERTGMPVLKMADLADKERLRSALRLLQLVKVDQAEQLLDAHRTQGDPRELEVRLADLKQLERVGALADAYHGLVAAEKIRLSDGPQAAEVAVFEGAQGVLLDREHGFFPHVTPSHTTYRNAELLLAEWAPRCTRSRIGIARGYMTRHGAGPLPTELDALAEPLREAHNGTGPWQGRFRFGWPDAVLLRYALDIVGGVDALVISCLDRLAGLGTIPLATAYEDPTTQKEIERLAVSACADPRGAESQERTAQLFRVVPKYEQSFAFSATEIQKSALEFARQFADAATASVQVISTGMTAADKHVLDARPFVQGARRDAQAAPLGLMTMRPAQSTVPRMSNLPSQDQAVRSSLVEYRVVDGVAVLSLNNPPANTYSFEMMQALDAAVLRARFAEDAHVIVVTGVGDRFFCAGADIAMLDRVTPAFKYNFCLHANETLLRLEHTPKLVIAALNGHTVGGGLEIALACDLRIAPVGASFKMGLPEVSLGVLPGTGGTQRLARLVGKSRAIELMVKGLNIAVADGVAAGLVTECIAVPSGEKFLDAAIAYAKGFCPPGRAAMAVGRIKRAVQTGAEQSLEAGLALERELQQQLFQSEDAKEGIRAYVEKRAAQFKGR